MKKNKITKIYVVTNGEYSDYRICGLFSTRSKAKYAKDKLFATSNPIETWALDKAPKTPPGKFKFQVCMDKEGNSEVKHISVENFFPIGQVPYGDNERMVFRMWARDKRHAVKIANEKRTRLIANNEWDEKVYCGELPEDESETSETSSTSSEWSKGEDQYGGS